MLTIPLDVALRIVRKRAARFGFAVVLPDDPRREAVIAAVFAAHKAKGTGVTYKHLRDGVTLTLPPVPSAAAALLPLIPVAGPTLAEIARTNGQTTMYPSPAALASGEALLPTWWHEEGHGGSIEHGDLAWCLAYLLSAEARASGEAPCYGAGMAIAVALGASGDDVAASAKRSLESYGLDADATKHAHGLIDSAAASVRAGDFGRVEIELREELLAEGVTL